MEQVRTFTSERMARGLRNKFMNDTNLVAALVNALASKPASDQTLLILTLILATVAPLLQAVVGFINSRALSAKIEASKIVNDETAKTVSSIKVDTNHDRTVMMEELRKLRDSVTALTMKNATLEEQKRSGEIASALAESPAAPALAAVNVGAFTDAQLAQLTQALRGVKGPSNS